MTGALGDCERLVGAWGQPVNALSSLAFVVAAVVVLRRGGSRWLAAALVVTGLGSALFHGPMPPGAQWAHDAGLAWLLVVAATLGTRWAWWGTWPALLAIGAFVALSPAPPTVVTAAAGVGAGGMILARDRSTTTLVAVGMLLAGLALARLSATGGPWCDPDSLWQGHAAWHLLAAIAVTMWGTAPATLESSTGPPDR